MSKSMLCAVLLCCWSAPASLVAQGSSHAVKPAVQLAIKPGDDVRLVSTPDAERFAVERTARRHWRRDRNGGGSVDGGAAMGAVALHSPVGVTRLRGGGDGGDVFGCVQVGGDRESVRSTKRSYD